MRNTVILFTTLKGGTGKTSICASTATFLVEQGIPTIVLDADVQQSLFRHRKRDLAAHPDEEIPWQVEFLNTTDIDKVRATIRKIKDFPCCVLIDCPGNVQDKALQVIFESADIAVIPYELNADSVDATVLFAELFRKNFEAKMYFIPNKVSCVYEKRGEVRKAREDALKALNHKLGTVTPDIRLTTLLNGYSTLDTYNYKKRTVIREALAPIIRFIQQKSK